MTYRIRDPRYLRIVCVVWVSAHLISAHTAAAQSSIPVPRTVTTSSSGFSTTSDTLIRQGERTADFFSSTGIAARPAHDPAFSLSAQVYRISVYGKPDKLVDAAGNITYKEHIAYQFLFKSYMIEGVGSLERSVKEYIASKKGSPVSFELPSYSWNTKRGDVHQLWLAGQFYGEAKGIPLSNANGDFVGSGSAGLGYTQQLNLDFAVNDKPGNVFVEASVLGSGLVGKQLVQVLDPNATGSLAGVVALDYRVGFQLLGSSINAITVNGTAYLTKVQGKHSTVSLGYSRSVQ